MAGRLEAQTPWCVTISVVAHGGVPHRARRFDRRRRASLRCAGKEEMKHE